MKLDRERLWSTPPTPPRFVELCDDDLVVDGVRWTFHRPAAGWRARREPAGTFAALVRDGVLAAHPWLRYPPAPSRPAVLEVERPAIPLERVLRVLSELLGFDASRRLLSATFERGGVTLEVYAKRPDGSRFAVDGEVAVDRIVIPIDGRA